MRIKIVFCHSLSYIFRVTTICGLATIKLNKFYNNTSNDKGKDLLKLINPSTIYLSLVQSFRNQLLIKNKQKIKIPSLLQPFTIKD